MPTYTYQCKTCGKIEDSFRKIADRDNNPICHGEMVRKIIPPMLQPVLGGGGLQGYKCPVTDKWITSRKERKNIMAEHNLIEKG